jgi:predicted Zn-dependent protease
MTVGFAPKRTSLGRYNRFILCIIGYLLVSLSSGCGDFTTQTIEHNYIVHVRASEPAVHAQFEKLVTDFNQAVGQEILSYSRNETVAASLVKLIPGLESNTGKLGFGGRVVYTNTTAFKIKRSYSMQIELDRNYVEKRIPSTIGSKSYNEVRLLFFHEVGHGLGFSHAASPSDVMYADLQGKKDFARFFEQIRNRPADQ